MGSSAKYNRDYYAKNKERLAEQKRRRYANDPEYREAIATRRKEWRDRQKAKRAASNEKSIPREQRGPKLYKIELDGVPVKVGMFSLGQAAYRIGISSQTIRKWESEGVLPPATYRSKGGHRLYTEDEVDVIRTVFKRFKKDGQRWLLTDDFIEALQSELKALNGGVRSGQDADNEEISDDERSEREDLG